MMQTHFSMNNFEEPLVGRNIDLISSDDDNIFQDIGLDAAVMYSRMNMLTENILESCCLTFPDTSLLLMPGTKTKNRETFDRDIGKAVCNMIQDSEEFVDIVMIDLNSGNDDLSFKLISSADLVIVNLTQRRYVLNKFFLEYEERFYDFSKVFFLFGNYDKNSGYNIRNCRRKYGKYINKNNSGVIPYCTRYMDAQNECELLYMVKKGLHMSQYEDAGKIMGAFRKKLRFDEHFPDETDYFFYQSCRSAEKIMNLLNISERKAILQRSGA